MAKMGRPTGYSDALADKMCEQLKTGLSVSELCRDPDMPSRQAFHKWLGEHPYFMDNYVRATSIRADRIFEEILEIADDGTNDYMERLRKDGSSETVLDNEHVQRSRLRIDARKWALARMSPAKYGDKLALQVTDETDYGKRLSKLNDEGGS